MLRLAGDTGRAATTSEFKDLRRQAQELKEVVAEQALDLRLLKKRMMAEGRRGLRYPASEKREIIRLVDHVFESTRRRRGGAKCRSPRTIADPILAGLASAGYMHEADFLLV
jgi:putative transposase